LARASGARVNSAGLGAVRGLLPHFNNLQELRIQLIAYVFLALVYWLVLVLMLPARFDAATMKTVLLVAWSFGTVYYLNIINSQNFDVVFLAASIALLLYFRTDDGLLSTAADSTGTIARALKLWLAPVTAMVLFAIALLPYAIGLAYYGYLRVSRPAVAAAPAELGGVATCCLKPVNAIYLATIERLRDDLVDLGLAHTKIFALDFANPFPFLLRALPPKEWGGVVAHRRNHRRTGGITCRRNCRKSLRHGAA
jgi:hypothetical protein